MNLTKNSQFASKFRVNYFNEVKLATQFVEEKVKNNESIGEDEINEVLQIIKSNLDKIKDLNPED